MLKKTDDTNFMKDPASGAIINTNIAAYKMHRLQRENEQTSTSIKTEVDNLKQDMSDIKKMLEILIQRDSNGTNNS
jgi:hypothetical protein